MRDGQIVQRSVCEFLRVDMTREPQITTIEVDDDGHGAGRGGEVWGGEVSRWWVYE